MNVKVGTRFQAVSVTPTIDTAIYAANDVVGGLMTFSVPSAVNGGVLNSALLVDEDDEKAALTLYLFDAEPTTIADQAAFAPTAADLKKLVCTIGLANYTSINSLAFCEVPDINQGFAADTLYGYLVCVATPEYTAVTDLTAKLMIVFG